MSEGRYDSSTGLTCLSCRVVFADGAIQREHYKSDWHRYNLQRKAVQLPPVSLELFQQKVLLHQKNGVDNTESVVMFCKSCNKQFQSKNAFDNHIRSKKHIECEKKAGAKNTATNNVYSSKKEEKDVSGKVEKRTEIVEAEEDLDVFLDKSESESSSDSEGWVTDHGSDDELDELDESKAIPTSTCLFCSLPSENTEKSLEHMSMKHGFFLPDIEYCTDVEGMLHYLGLKVGSGNLCLLCSDKVRRFYSVDACQRHMRDKGHCRVAHEAGDMLEYENFYDYSSMYPEDEGEEEVPVILDNFSLILPSGAQIGHRSLMRYYKQRIRPTSDHPKVKRGKDAVKSIINQYRAIGWTGTSGSLALQRARDISFMKKLDSKQWMKLGVKSSKLFKSRGRSDQ